MKAKLRSIVRFLVIAGSGAALLVASAPAIACSVDAEETSCEWLQVSAETSRGGMDLAVSTRAGTLRLRIG